MKNILNRTKISVTATLCAAAMVALSAGSAFAEKGAETLVKLTRADRAVSTAPVAPVAATAKTMACPTCTDRAVIVTATAAKMGRTESIPVLRHDCARCANKVVLTGHGKARKETVIHSCGEKVSTCCNVAKN